MTRRKSIKGYPPEVGDLFEIPLSSGLHGYGRVLRNPLMAFYAIGSKSSLYADDVLNAPIAFKIWVMNSALSSGRWRVVANLPLEPDHEVSPWFFKQDPVSKKLSIYREGDEKPALPEECANLERAAVWSAEHAEDRLDDHLANRRNKWVEALKLRV